MNYRFSKRALVIAVLMLLLSAASVFAANISIDGMPVQFTQASGQPFVDGANRTQVPLRATMEAFGCEVSWNAESSTATVSKEGVVVEVPIGAQYIIRNGETKSNDTAALLKDGRTYLPIRAILEAFGALVEWDGATETVMIQQSKDDKSMKVHFIDVGQGDAIFVDYGEYELLIDAGDNEYGDDVVAYIYPYVDDAIEMVIATHAHADHIGGLDDVFKAYSIDTLLTSGSTSTSVTWKDFQNEFLSAPHCVRVTDANMMIPFGSDAMINVLDPGDDFSNENNNSVIITLQYEDTIIGFMGDLESDAEANILNKMGDIDVLKAGHHGSATASSVEFLAATAPEVVIVSAGIGNTYGHPHLETMERFSTIGAVVYGTFKSGTIVMTANDNSYRFDTDMQITTADAGASASSSSEAETNAPTQPANHGVSKSEAAYVGNDNTMKFHTINCRYVDSIHLENIVYFKNRGDAISKGHVPCKVCRP